MLVLRLLSLAAIVQCLHWDSINPTGIVDYPLGQPQPPPTPAPLGGLVRKQEVGDTTCGYFETTGILSGIYCTSQWECATNALHAYGCCDRATIDNCALHTACLDSTAVGTGGASDPQVLSCTSTAAPYCGTGYLELGSLYTAFGCISVPNIIITIYSTALGYTTVTYANAVYVPTQTALTSKPGPTGLTPNPVSTSLNPNPASATSGSTVTSTPPASSSTSSTPVGAIVGGVVGGIAVIALVVAGVFLIIHFSKKKKATETQDTTRPAMQDSQVYSPPAPPVTYPSPTGYQAPYPTKTELPNQGYMPSASPQPESVQPSSGHYSLVPPYSPQSSVVLPARTPPPQGNFPEFPQAAPSPQGNYYELPQMAAPPQGNFHELPQTAAPPQGNFHELPQMAAPQGNFHELPDGGR